MSEQQSSSFSENSVEAPEPKQKKKVFEFNYGQIVYSNVQETSHLNDQNSEFIVHNFLAQQDGNTLVKITEIMMKNQILRIRDEFKIHSELNQKGVEKKRLGIFGRRNNYSDPSNKQKSDTKNLIKNIVNLFSNWLSTQNNDISQKANRKFKQIFKKMKYFNKQLIQQMCRDKDVCNCFVEFSQTQSDNLIQNSRIKDKSCHLKAMKNYAKLFLESKQKLETGEENGSKKSNSVSTGD